MNNLLWEDLVFAKRNQAYGAYPLRKAYSGRVTKSFVFAMTLVSLMLSYPFIKSIFGNKVETDHTVVVRDTITWIQPPPIETIPLPPPPTHVQVEQIRYVPPRVTEEDVATEIPTNEELANVTISNQAVEGDPVFTDFPTDPDPVAVEEDPTRVWITVEQQPEFPGGLSEMMKFVNKHIKYPSAARRMSIAGTVFISFVVNADGTIDQIETIKGIYADCDKEAMRVIGKMPAWKPGKQNGKAVKVRFVLPIKFALSDV
jgi:protein TonB